MKILVINAGNFTQKVDGRDKYELKIQMANHAEAVSKLDGVLIPPLF